MAMGFLASDWQFAGLPASKEMTTTVMADSLYIILCRIL
jgi:hypothetical protein